MERAQTLAVDAALGFGLCMVTAARAFIGDEVTNLSWEAALVAVMVCGALVLRHWWPLVTLGIAMASGVLGMLSDIKGSPVDALVGISLLAVTVYRVLRNRDGDHDASRLAHSLLRLWHWRVLAFAVVGVGIVVAIPVDLKEAAGVALVLSAYAVALATDRTTVVVSGTVAAGALVVGPSLATTDAWSGPDTPVPLIAATLIGIAAGDAVRSRREMIVEREERARQVRRAIDEEAHRRVVEERLRIAREVHDLVAHHIAVVSMQAGVAAHHLHDHPQATAEALGHVRTASQRVLDELGTLLSVLRDTDDPVAPVEPTPGLGDLQRLLDSFTAAGLNIECALSGSPRTLPSTVDASAYRIIQESLTNARKHGAGDARLNLAYGQDWLEIDVRNTCPGTDQSGNAADGNGHGLAGMHERVTALGGTLETRPAAGEFVVWAQLPIVTKNAEEQV